MQNNLLISLDETNQQSESYLSEERVEKFEIRKLTWEDFLGQPDSEDISLALTKWRIGYNYSIVKQDDRISVQVDVWCKVDPTSWVRTRFQELLNHQQGHYYIGVICALTFKKLVSEYPFSENYKAEISDIFNKTLQDHLEMERTYDIETLNMLNTAKQRQWDTKILKLMNQLQKYA
ncbi:hypothetical protein pb186bvf_013379 [Paramecium bursaria]